MQFRFSIVMFGALAFAACGGGSGGGGGGGDDDDVAVDAAIPDTPSATNALGQLCPAAQGGGGTECPAGNTCIVLQGLGSTTTGYCTPDCMNNSTICTTGYTGPAGGMPQCVLRMSMDAPPTGCAIVCTDDTQCPNAMACTAANAQVKICAPPA